MQKILVAGGTGYLGHFLLQALKKRGYWVRALVRKEAQKEALSEWVDECVVGQITKPDTLVGLAEGMDGVFSSVGITRQKDGLTYEDVDYQGNLNLLREAERAGVQRFLYVSVLNGDQLGGLKIIDAKERFVQALIDSPIPHTIMRPSGFFSDMKELLDMAHSGRIYLFGTGQLRLNPIAGEDLAEVCVDSYETKKESVDVGGPDILTHHQMAELAFKVLDKPAKITYFPMWLIPIILFLLRTFTSSKTYGPVEFFLTALSKDQATTPYGKQRLEAFFQESI